MPRSSTLYIRIRDILESARTRAARSVNTTQVAANWLIGREIVEEEQKGSRRAGYGDRLMLGLSKRLQREYGGGYGLSSLKDLRAFYGAYPRLLHSEKGHAVRGFFTDAPKSHAVRGFSARGRRSDARTGASDQVTMMPDSATKDWVPGRLHANLSWTHYRLLLRVDPAEARAFYEIEAIQQCWSARELERQIASLLFERLAKSRDKAGVLRLAAKGHEITAPGDVFKDPVVIEFLGLPESHRLIESEVEQALLDQLQSFLLELGKGFAFVARQRRLTLDGDHFYVDLVFYHIVLKCYILLDLLCGRPHKRSSVVENIMWRWGSRSDEFCGEKRSVAPHNLQPIRRVMGSCRAGASSHPPCSARSSNARWRWCAKSRPRLRRNVAVIFGI